MKFFTMKTAFLGLASMLLATSLLAALPQGKVMNQRDAADAYIQPHAPVDVLHKVLGPAMPGQPVDVEIILMPSRVAEAVSAEFRPGPGMRESRRGRAERVGGVDRPMAMRQVVTFVPSMEGVHYITVFASVQVDGEVQDRVVAFPIQVGKSSAPVRKMEAPMGELKPDGEGGYVREMPAVQTMTAAEE
ncbi:MAG: hypothetical protein MUP90_06995 [Gammaproteobacteria bacterium]|nr:hypothetical protein [Gammaproteobacteria bacterium]